VPNLKKKLDQEESGTTTRSIIAVILIRFATADGRKLRDVWVEAQKDFKTDVSDEGPRGCPESWEPE